MAENEHIDADRLRPIDTQHGTSRQVVHDWLAAGMPRDLILDTVAEVVARYRPDNLHDQVSSLAYLDKPVRERFEAERSAAVDLPDRSDRKRQDLRRALDAVLGQDPDFRGGLPDQESTNVYIHRRDRPLWNEVLQERGLQPIDGVTEAV